MSSAVLIEMVLSEQPSCSRGMVPVATTDAVENDIGTTAQTNVREVRTVLGEVQQSQLRPRCRKPSDEEEKMDTNTESESHGHDKELGSDWSTLRATLEAAFGTIGQSTNHGSRGAEIRSKREKGHLEYVCNEGCFEDTTLGELRGIQFPGAFSKKSIGSLWNAWRAASIFIRTDIDMTSKIKFWKDGAVCLDEEALQKVLRLAYDKCLDWTEFVCMTEGIKKHEKIDAFSFELTYDAALKKLKKELAEEEEKRPIKEGPTAFAAPASATLLEKDGPKRGICTRVATSFKQLREVLMEWKANTIWVLVWPVDLGLKKDDILAIVKACDEHFEEGGRIVGVWPPIVEKTLNNWKAMSEIWTMLDETLAKRAGTGQFVRTASSKIENGHVFCEVGSPESTLYFYGSDCTVGCAKMLYETIRKRICSVVPLPELRRVEFQTMRTSSQEGGGMWRGDRSTTDRPAKRRDLGARTA